MMYIPLIPLCNVYKTTPVVCCKKFGTKPVLSLDINLFFGGTQQIMCPFMRVLKIQ